MKKRHWKRLCGLLLTLALLCSLTVPALADNAAADEAVAIYSGSGLPHRNAYVTSITMSGAELLALEGGNGQNPTVYLNASNTANNAVLTTDFTGHYTTDSFVLEMKGLGEVQLVNGRATQVVTATARIGSGGVVLDSATWTINYRKAYYCGVTLPRGDGFVTAPVSGYESPVFDGGDFAFTVTVDEVNYEKGPDFVVKTNDIPLVPDANGVYTISNITQNQEVTVEGVIKREPYLNYSIGSAEGNVGSSLTIPVSLQSNLPAGTVTQFVHAFSYDAAALELSSVESTGHYSGMPVTVDTTTVNGLAIITVGSGASGVSYADGQILKLHFTVRENALGTLDNTLQKTCAITALSAAEYQSYLSREPVVRYEEEDVTISDLLVAQAGEIRIFTATVLTPPVLTRANAVGTAVTVVSPGLSSEDTAAAIQYRMSADGVTWDDAGWQTSNVFTVPASGGTFWFQSRYYSSNKTYYLNSPPSNAISVTTSSVTSVTLDSHSLNLAVGAAAELNAAVVPADAPDTTVSWTSSEPAVASVEDGVVTALSVGTATITATAGGLSDTCAITVRAADVPATEDVLIYDDRAGTNKVPYSNAYLSAITLNGVGVDDVECVRNGSSFTVTVRLSSEVQSGAVWNVTASKTASSANMGNRLLITTGPILWKADGTAVQTVKADYNNGYRVGTWTILYIPAPDAATQAVIALIDAIGEVDRQSGMAIYAAREAYDALNAEQKLRVSNYDVLLAAEEFFASLGDCTVLEPPALDPVPLAVTTTAVTLAIPAASLQDAGATVQYRVSKDGVNWSAWQSSNVFTSLEGDTVYFFQARYHTSDIMNFDHSQPSATVRIKTPAPTVIEVSNYEEFREAFLGAGSGGSETIIRVVGDVHQTQDDKHQLHMPAGANVTIEGAGGNLYISHGAQNYGYYIDEGGTLTLRDINLAMIREYDLYWIPQNCWEHFFRINGNGVTVNIDNVKFYNNMGASAASIVSAAQNVEATVNVYSLIANPYFSGYAMTLSLGGNVTLNLMPTDDIYLMGQVLYASQINVIPQPGHPIKSGATRTGSTWTAMNATTLAQLNAGTTVDLTDLTGYSLFVSDADPVPVPMTAPTVAEAGTPEAETADVVYTVGNTDFTFVINSMKSPEADSFLMIYGPMQQSGTPGTPSFWRAYSDKSDGLFGLGNTYTFYGLEEDTAYDFRVGWFSLESGYCDVIVDLPLHTSYIVRQLNAPQLNDKAEKTTTSITLTPPDPCTQDETATLAYRMSEDGENWGEWQESETFTGLTPATTYWFQVKYVAVDYHWSDSEPSNTVELSSKTATLTPPALSDTPAALTSDSVTLEAPAASAEDAEATVEYRMSEDGGENWGAWQTSPAFEGLTPKTAYAFQARYVPSGTGWLASEPSNTVTVTTKGSENAPTFAVGTAYGAPGSEVQVTVSLKNNPGIVCAVLELNYDRELLELVSVEDAALLPGYVGSNNLSVYPFILSWEASTSESNLTENGVLATVTFRVKAAAAEGESARVWLSYDPENVYDVELENVAFETEEGSVVVGEAPSGFTVTLVDRVPSGSTSLTAGEYSGEVSFTVTNGKACVVLTLDGDGQYTRLAAAKENGAENTYRFTVTVDRPLTVIVSLKGDVDGNGAVSVSDVSLLNRSLLSHSARAYKALSPEQTLIADVDGSGSVSVGDASLLSRSLLSPTARAYRALTW